MSPTPDDGRSLSSISPDDLELNELDSAYMIGASLEAGLDVPEVRDDAIVGATVGD